MPTAEQPPGSSSFRTWLAFALGAVGTASALLAQDHRSLVWLSVLVWPVAIAVFMSTVDVRRRPRTAIEAPAPAAEPRPKTERPPKLPKKPRVPRQRPGRSATAAAAAVRAAAGAVASLVSWRTAALLVAMSLSVVATAAWPLTPLALAAWAVAASALGVPWARILGVSCSLLVSAAVLSAVGARSEAEAIVTCAFSLAVLAVGVAAIGNQHFG